MTAKGPPPYSSEFVALVEAMHAPGRGAPDHPRWIRDHLGGRTEEIRARIIPALRRFLDLEGAKTLDFGCGTGSSMVALLEAGCRVTGIDPDPASCRMATMRLAEHGLDAEVLHVPDTARLPFEANRFDLVLANGVFEHIRQPQRRAFFDEAWRVVRVGGVFYIAETPNRLLPYDFHTTHLALLPWLPPRLAEPYALWRRRIVPGMDLELSGYRGMTWWELKGLLRGKAHRILNDEADPDDLEFFRRERMQLPSGRLRGAARRAFYGLGRLLETLGISPRYLFPNIEAAVRREDLRPPHATGGPTTGG